MHWIFELYRFCSDCTRITGRLVFIDSGGDSMAGARWYLLYRVADLVIARTLLHFALTHIVTAHECRRREQWRMSSHTRAARAGIFSMQMPLFARAMPNAFTTTWSLMRAAAAKRSHLQSAPFDAAGISAVYAVARNTGFISDARWGDLIFPARILELKYRGKSRGTKLRAL